MAISSAEADAEAKPKLKKKHFANFSQQRQNLTDDSGMLRKALISFRIKVNMHIDSEELVMMTVE